MSTVVLRCVSGNNVYTLVLIMFTFRLFIAKRIVHNRRDTCSQPPDPHGNSSINVNPVHFIGNSENKGLSADGYYSTIADPTYEVNLRGL